MKAILVYFGDKNKIKNEYTAEGYNCLKLQKKKKRKHKTKTECSKKAATRIYYVLLIENIRQNGKKREREKYKHNHDVTFSKEWGCGVLFLTHKPVCNDCVLYIFYVS